MEIEYNKNMLNIIDIRDNIEYNLGHITNTINIPSSVLINSANQILNKSTTYYLYCNHGIKSKTTCELLNKLGYRCYSIKGGYSLYLKQKTCK